MLEFVFSDPSNNALRWYYDTDEDIYKCLHEKTNRGAGCILGREIVSPEETTPGSKISQLRRMLWKDWSERNG